MSRIADWHIQHHSIGGTASSLLVHAVEYTAIHARNDSLGIQNTIYGKRPTGEQSTVGAGTQGTSTTKPSLWQILATAIANPSNKCDDTPEL